MNRVLAAALLLVASAAHAQQQPAAPPPKQAPAGPPIVVEGQRDKKICHSETSTGSIIPRRVCRTEAEASEQQAAAQHVMETIQHQIDSQRHVDRFREATGK